MEERKIIIVNTMCYHYPNGDKKFIKFKTPLVIEKDKPKCLSSDFLEDEKDDSEKDHEGNKERSIRRTSTTVAHYCQSNAFDWFVTLTFDESKVTDRYDLESCVKDVSKWLRKQTRKYGRFRYILIPEYHPSSGGIHFHGVIGGYQGNFTIAKTRKGRVVHHLNDWQSQLGYTDCEPIEHIGKVSNYLRKYITKDMIYVFGKQKYLCSQGLALPEVEYNVRIPEDLEGEYENDMCISGYKKHVDTNLSL